MKNTTSSNPKTGVKVVASLLAASQVASAADSTENIESLEPTTVVATKFEKNLSDVSASVAVLDVDQLKREGKVSVQDAIGYRTPGVIVTSTSGQGSQPASIFVRGTTTAYSQTRVDGVRITDSNSSIQNFLGSSNHYGLSNIEVLKGASSSVYGAGAIGGVISLVTAKGEGDNVTTAGVEFGSYDSWLGRLSTQGQSGDFSYNFGVSAEDSKNDSDATIDGNDSTQLSYFGRFDVQLDDQSSVGLTVRGGDSRYETPQKGNPLTNTTQTNRYDYIFATLFYESDISDAWSTRFTLGYNTEDFDSRGFAASVDAMYMPTGGFEASNYDTDLDRTSVYWDNKVEWSDALTATYGAYFETSEFKSFYKGAPSTKGTRDTYGLYLNHAWQVNDSIQLNGTIGWDEHDDFEDHLAWNTGVIFQLTDTTALKANAGEAFAAPQFFHTEINPELEGEQSFSWDVGVEQVIGSSKLSLTWFETDVDNKIEYQGFHPVTFESIYGNSVQKRKANGLEVAFDTELESLNSEIFASYSYLQNALANEIPQQTASAVLTTTFCDQLNSSVSCNWVDQAESYNGNKLEDYFIVNLQANYQVNESVKVHARVENLLDDDYRLGNFTGPNYYDELSSVKGRGRGFYGGVTVSF